MSDDRTILERRADRPPTDEEARAADRAAADVDVDEVGEHFQAAARTGAAIKGEGEITPDPQD
jgi:hypothetical protein